MAPGAQLYLICIDTEVDLGQAKDYAKAQGSRSSTTPSAGSTPAAATAAAARHAGRDRRRRARQRHPLGQRGRERGQRALERHVHRPDGDRSTTSPARQRNTVFLAAGEQICGFLKWDAWPTTPGLRPVLSRSATCDRRVAVRRDPSTTRQRDGADRRASATRTLRASRTSPSRSTRFSATTAPRFDLFVTSAALEYRRRGRQRDRAGASPNAFAVGAICWNGDGLEPYSSLGPTIDGRVKPDIAGQAASPSAIFGAFTACGTSGFTARRRRAPHVAGAAALWKGSCRSSRATESERCSRAEALDLGPAGADSSFGAGSFACPPSSDAATQAGTRYGDDVGLCPRRHRSTGVDCRLRSGGSTADDGIRVSETATFRRGQSVALPQTPDSASKIARGLAGEYHFRAHRDEHVRDGRRRRSDGRDVACSGRHHRRPSTLGATRATVTGTVDPERQRDDRTRCSTGRPPLRRFAERRPTRRVR